ncbi:hypothetical protein Niako_5780 [Niastella koreensis GR20-10]|uniref:Uncharacterized protein n=1 Tax=Niastella koreensis (strain DSM 17620 / KACC 11465 / NBRC 106392 / GR20-10) TaxID=700598 RepID=G8TMM3_NIAKG|nr:hypothetical protein [Niastella koreensis]AEW02011.1 hypothetical protein Niako_5780 [Niastella koreensis GR20-10]
MSLFSLIIEVICFLASLALFFQASLPRYLKTFPFFLLLTIIIEIIGDLLVKRKIDSIPMYNIFTTFEFIFYLYILRRIIYNVRVKKLIVLLMAIYPVLVLINMLFFQENTFHTNTYSLGCLLIVGACIYYFYEIFQTTHSVNLVKEPAFWICSGLLFFYTCSFPLVGLWNHLYGLPRIILLNLNAVLQILNILLYSLFSIAFLCRVRFRKIRTVL